MNEGKYVEEMVKDGEKNVEKEVVVKGLMRDRWKDWGGGWFVMGKEEKSWVGVEGKGNMGGLKGEVIG